MIPATTWTVLPFLFQEKNMIPVLPSLLPEQPAFRYPDCNCSCPEAVKFSRIISRIDDLGQRLDLTITRIAKSSDSLYLLVLLRHQPWNLQCWCAVLIDDDPEDLLKVDFPLFSVQRAWRDICEARFDSCINKVVK